jgi:hypothetical protein
VDARAALAAGPHPGPVPIPPLPPRRPGHPAALPLEPPPWHGGLREDLLALAADAATRAWELAVGLSADAGLGLGPDADLARRADQALGSAAFSVLVSRCGVDGRELARLGLAWRHGGATGLEVLHNEWDPATANEEASTAELLKSSQATLRDATGTAATVVRNRVTAGSVQLRLGRDLLWYPYARSDGDWEPAGPPQPDPARAAEVL